MRKRKGTCETRSRLGAGRIKIAMQSSPTSLEIRAAREAAGLSQDAAAALLYKARGTWAQWEAREGSPNHRAMDPAFWELFQLKARPKPG